MCIELTPLVLRYKFNLLGLPPDYKDKINLIFFIHRRLLFLADIQIPTKYSLESLSYIILVCIDFIL